MPLVILGLIVVLGVVFLIYYQLGPKTTDRIKSGLSDIFGGIFGGGGGAAGGGMAPGAGDAGASAEGGPGGADQATGQQAVKSLPSEEKVLYIFGDGAREERPLDGDEGKDDNA